MTKQSTKYVDHIEFMPCPGLVSEDTEVRGYLSTEHTDAWLVYLWSDETLRIPIHRVASVTTTEELFEE